MVWHRIKLEISPFFCFQIETEENAGGQGHEKETEELKKVDEIEVVVEIEKEEDLGPGKGEEKDVIDTIGHIKIAIRIEGPILIEKIKNVNLEVGEKMRCLFKKQISYGNLLD